MKLSFHPYVDHKQRSSYATWTSVLLHAGPGARDGLELKLDWASGLAWTSFLASYGGGQGLGHLRASLVGSPSPWGVLPLGPGSQG